MPGFEKKHPSMHFIRFLYFKDLTPKILLLFSILRNLFGLEPLAITPCLYNEALKSHSLIIAH